MLKRTHARLCTVLLVLTILFAGLPVWMYNVMRADALWWAFLGVGGASFCGISMMIVKSRCLRCPVCGRSSARPQWSAGKRRYYCPCCGKPFVYDDEVREEREKLS